MNIDELAVVYDTISDFIDAGKEKEASEYLSLHFERLPEEVRNEILGRIFANSIVEEAKGVQVVEDIQQEGMDMVKALLSMKEKLKQEKRTTT